MLSRRQLRIKVLQALYAYYQDERHNLQAAERELFRGIDKSYDLYLSLVLLLVELLDEEERYLADKPKAKLATSIQERPKKLLKDNLFLRSLRSNPVLIDLVRARKISWQADHDMVNKIFGQLKKSPDYENSELSVKRTWKDDTEFVLRVYQKFIAGYEPVVNLLEEKNIYFAESFDFINSMIVKNLKASARSADEEIEIYPLFRDEDDDRDFVRNLFIDTINNKLITEKFIEEKSTNWDIDRLALLDVIILKMAISEIIRFSTIPVKVSINEYIDLSKDYSSPKSSVFVNGVLDKIVMELKEQGKVVKMGRGLIE